MPCSGIHLNDGLAVAGNAGVKIGAIWPIHEKESGRVFSFVDWSFVDWHRKAHGRRWIFQMYVLPGM